MKNRFFRERHYTFWISFILVIVAIWAGIGIFADEEEQEEVHVSVIVEDANNTRWTAFQQGVEEASRDLDVDLTYVTTGQFTDEKEEWDLVGQRVDDGADGIILSPYAAGNPRALREKLIGRVKIILVESGMNITEDSDKELISVAPNHQEMGIALMEELENDLGTDLNGKRVKIVSSNVRQLGTIQIIDILKKEILERGGSVLSIDNLSNSGNADYLEGDSTDVIIALDDKSLLTIAKEKAGRADVKIPLYGIGCSDSNVYYLERKIIQCMVVPNDFEMGYLSLSELTNMVRGHREDGKSAEVSFKAVRPDEIHDVENERFLFPVVQ